MNNEALDSGGRSRGGLQRSLFFEGKSKSNLLDGDCCVAPRNVSTQHGPNKQNHVSAYQSHPFHTGTEASCPALSF